MSERDQLTLWCLASPLNPFICESGESSRALLTEPRLIRAGSLCPKSKKRPPVPLNNPTGRKQADIDECPSDEQVEAVSPWQTVSESRPGGSVMLLRSGSSPARWQLMIKVTSVRFPKSLLTRSSPASLQPSPSVRLLCLSLSPAPLSPPWSRTGGEQ